jgi:release factor glutamine methyltransferase
MTIQVAYQQLLSQLIGVYDESEAENISNMVIEYITLSTKMQRVINKEQALSDLQASQLSVITNQLLLHKPIQYVLNEAWFAGMKLYVDENVLIPRPETEELVQWILDEVQSKDADTKTVLDIGTGSGCIPIALKKKLPKLNVRAVDVSETALNVAIKNAMLQAVQVYFIRMDFLQKESWNQFGKFDIIVSNPPYVKQSESLEMHKNVLEHEPHLALFVPDNDALLFYRNIAAFSTTHLADIGAVFLEINETLGNGVAALFNQEGFATELRKDMQGKDRMIKAVKR